MDNKFEKHLAALLASRNISIPPGQDVAQAASNYLAPVLQQIADQHIGNSSEDFDARIAASGLKAVALAVKDPNFFRTPPAQLKK